MNALNLTAFHNLGSLVLGMAALLLGGFAIISHSSRRCILLSTGSFCVCSVSLLLQIAEISHRIHINDYSAIADTIGAVLFASVALFLSTFLLCTIAIIRHYRR